MPWQHALLGALICAPFLLCVLCYPRRLSAPRSRAEVFRARIDEAVEEAITGWRRDEKRRAKLRAVNDRRVRARLGLRP